MRGSPDSLRLRSALALVAAFLAFAFFPARIPRDSVLMIRLSGRMREHSLRSPLDQLMGRGFPSLHQLRRAIEAARSDASVSVAIVEIAGLEIGLATASEIHDLLSSLRTAGKRVVAILAGDNATVREYLAASGAGEVVANPDLGMMMLGVAAGSFFLKGALAKMHIQAQTLQYKEYKGAAEMFNRDAMSPALRESLEAIVADWQVTMAGKVAAARKIDPERARRLLGEGFISAETAREAGLIDRAGYVEGSRGRARSRGARQAFRQPRALPAPRRLFAASRQGPYRADPCSAVRWWPASPHSPGNI